MLSQDSQIALEPEEANVVAGAIIGAAAAATAAKHQVMKKE